MSKSTLLSKIAFILTLVGGINWGLVGLVNWNLVRFIFQGFLEQVVYTLVGISALYTLYVALFKRRAFF